MPGATLFLSSSRFPAETSNQKNQQVTDNAVYNEGEDRRKIQDIFPLEGDIVKDAIKRPEKRCAQTVHPIDERNVRIGVEKL